MEEFQKWTDDYNLVHLPTTGAEYTWDMFLLMDMFLKSSSLLLQLQI
jgi:hypothetical protein